MGTLIRASGLVGVLLCGAVGGCGSGGGTGVGGGIVQPVRVGDSFAGASYEDLSAAWWNWCSAIRFDEHPVASDPTGAFAGIGQSGDFWFLAGTFGGFAERTVTIPAGKALFFPLFNTAYWMPEDAPSLAECAAGAAGGPNQCDILECEVDGTAIPDLFSYRIPSGPWLLQIPPGGIFTEPQFGGYDPGTRTAMGDGFWMFLKPLSRGAHTIHLRGGISGMGGFEVEALYHLTVV